MEKPEDGNSKSQAIKRSRSGPAPLSASVDEGLEEPVSEGVRSHRQERKEEGISECGQEEEFVASGPGVESGALEGQFGLMVANGHLDLPAAGIGQDDLPGEGRGMSRLVGE